MSNQASPTQKIAQNAGRSILAAGWFFVLFGILLLVVASQNTSKAITYLVLVTQVGVGIHFIINGGRMKKQSDPGTSIRTVSICLALTALVFVLYVAASIASKKGLSPIGLFALIVLVYLGVTRYRLNKSPSIAQ